MLLDAPSDMRCFLMVADKVRRMFGVVPGEWVLDDTLAGLQTVADWSMQHASALKQQLGDALEPTASAERSHPMYGLLTRHPIYSMLCNSQQLASHEDEFLLLQLHVLIARSRELHRQESSTTIALTLSYTNKMLQTMILPQGCDSPTMPLLPCVN